MRPHIGKYEIQIRLALVVIVVLLLLLNISSTYVLHSVNTELRDDADYRLGHGLDQAARYLEKNDTNRIEPDQEALIARRFGILDISARDVRGADPRILSEEVAEAFSGDSRFPGLDPADMARLVGGSKLFRSGNPGDIRFGLVMADAAFGRKLLIVARIDATVADKIGRAARTTLYLAGAILLLIIPLVISLPGWILKPFRVMRETALTAGRLSDPSPSDEVNEVIQSYESIVNELKRNELELERLYRETSSKADRLERLYRYILRSIGSGVITVDMTGKVIAYNRAAMEILGYAEEEVVGKYYLVAFSREMELCLLIEAGLLRGEVVATREVELVRAGQAHLWLSVESSLIYDDSDRVVGVTLLVTDYTALKKLQEELEMNRRLASLGEMTGGLAHQLRNSLAAISGFSQLLQKKAGADSALAEIAGSIRTEAASSETMLGRFLTFARPLSLSQEVIEFRQLVSDLIDKYAAPAAVKSISIELDCPPDALSLIGDPLLLKEALGNLIDNALQAVEVGGRITVALGRSGGQIDLTLTDDGPGIPEKIKDDIFTPFVSSKPSGTGLGLSLAQKIITLHKGGISFECPDSGGTIFRVVLPTRIDEPLAVPSHAGSTAKNQ